MYKVRSLVMRFVILYCSVVPLAAFSQEILTTIPVLQKRCDADKDPASCYEIGLLFFKTSDPNNKRDGMTFMMKGCRIEMSRECKATEAEERARKSRDMQVMMDKKIHEEKVKFTEGNMNPEEIDCWNGNAKACHEAGMFYTFIATDRNEKKGIMLYEEGCRLGDKESCSWLDMFRKGLIKVFSVETE